MSNPSLQSPLNRASKDKFILALSLPPILRRRASIDPSLDIEKVQISVYGAIVPPIIVPAVEVRFGGQSANFSSHSRPNYPPLSVNFVVDNDYSNYYVLWKWLALLNNPSSSVYSGTPTNRASKQDIIENGSNTEYQTNLSVLALNEYNKTAVEFIYTNAFITNLGGINYSYRDGDILETTADFQYNQLEIIKHQPK
jgi:hypothetical protein